MKKLLLITSFALLVFCLNATKYYYISTVGSDSNEGTIDKPFATINKARDVIALLPLSENVIVYLRGGTYLVESPINFGSINSGTNGFNISYEAYTGEKPILSAGKSIIGWTPYKDGIWKANVTFNFRNLYIDGIKAQRGRTPNTDLTLPTEPPTTGFYVANGYIDSNSNFTSNPVEFCGNVEWMSKKMRISSFTPNGSNTTILINPVEWDSYTNGPQGYKFHKDKAYWFENDLKFVDSPGEWFLDKIANTVYYFPRSNENILTANVQAGGVESIIKINGISTNPVKNIKFKGLTFIGTGWLRPDLYGFVDIQANSIVPPNRVANANSLYRHNLKKDKMPGVIHVLYGDTITIDNCEFKNIAAGGIVFEEGGKNIIITNNKLTDIGGNGIEIGSDYYKASAGSIMFHKNVNISNNYLQNIANEYYGGVGILAYYVTGLTIDHNRVKDVPYSGISAGWGWNTYEAVSSASNYSITNNRVENFMTKLRDGGGIYVTNPISGSNSIENNYILGNSNSYSSTSGTVGIYHDGAAKNWLTHSNVIENFYQPISFQTIYGQVANNITAQNNYTKPDSIWYSKNTLQCDSMASRSIVINGNTNTTGNWSTPAQTIIDNTNLIIDSTTDYSINVALKKPTATSSFNILYPSYKAVDGNRIASDTTRWVSSVAATVSFPQWIEINLVHKYSINRIKFWTGSTAFGYSSPIKDFTLRYWDGTTWQNAFTQSNNTNTEYEKSFTSITTDKIQLQVTNSNSQIIRLCELEIYGELIPFISTNVALKKTATTTSVNGSYIGDNAIDGNKSNTNDATRWVSASAPTATSPQSIVIDLGAYYTIDSLKSWTGMNGAGYSYPLRNFEFKYWDGTNWNQLIQETTNINPSYTKKFAAVTTNKVCLKINDASGNALGTSGGGIVRLFEIEVYGVSAFPELNVALEKTTVASSGATYGSKAVDGNYSADVNTRWTSGILPTATTPQYIAVELGDYYYISRFRFYTGDSGIYNSAISSYKFYYYKNSSWIEISSVSDSNNTNATIDKSFDAVKTNRVKLDILAPTTDFVKLLELEVYGIPVLTVSTPNPVKEYLTSIQPKKNNSLLNLSLFPNPLNNNDLFLSLNDVTLPNNFSIKITDLTGRTVYKRQFTSNASNTKIQIDRSIFFKGIYFVSVSTDLLYNCVTKLIVR